MKKSGLLALVAAVALIGANPLKAAEKSAAGGLELSGNVDVVTGWQHDGDHTNPNGAEASAINSVDSSGAGVGQLGDFRGPSAPSRDTYNFYIDQVELDLNRTFGENIRVRADLDFGRSLSGSGRSTGGSNFQLEQGYVTANIPVGNGLEFLIGRFNAPIGLESVDRADNMALSYSNTYRFIRPQNVTGMKIYYAFNDVVDWHLYAVNNLYDTITSDTPIPSYGTRLGFTWGEKGQENVFGVSYAGGPEGAVNLANAGAFAATAVNSMSHFTHIGDIDFSFHVTDAFVIAGEAIYRQDNVNGGLGACSVTSGPNCKSLGGNVLLGYNFNESWNGWLRYDYLHDIQGNYTGIDQQIHSGAVGAAYQITEGAKVKMEYRLDLGMPADTVSADNIWNHGFALEFAYNF